MNFWMLLFAGYLAVNLLFVLLFWVDGKWTDRQYNSPTRWPGRRSKLGLRFAQTAPVRPRVVTESGDVLPLEEEIRQLYDNNDRGAIRITGGPGTGKTTALKHLAAVFLPDGLVKICDDADPDRVSKLTRQSLVVYTTSPKEPEHLGDLATFRLAPWNRDDLIEYLLAVHPEECASVMSRLDLPAGELPYQGRPEIWGVILDVLAIDPDIPDASTALILFLLWLEPDRNRFQAQARQCLSRWSIDPGRLDPPPQETRTPKSEFEKLLRHGHIQILLAAEQFADELRRQSPAGEKSLASWLPRNLIEATAKLLAGEEQTLSYLRSLVSRPLENHAMLASLLHAAGAEWSPEFCATPDLTSAYLDGIRWPGVNLNHAELSLANFSQADLSQAYLNGARAQRVNFCGAQLSGATLKVCDLREADLSDANLQGADFSSADLIGANLQRANLENAILSGACLIGTNLEGANFRRADLSAARLTSANLAGVDFSDANLQRADLNGHCFREVQFDGVNFRDANLEHCDLEETRCVNVNFENANLASAFLTGSMMTNANFSQASLRGARLAEISWEGACLRGADLRGATFHMGSSRSGLLFTGIASEGTRTGFYTDEFDEQSFRDPEEIRKANLCGADLRGALLAEVDFYLVDLRWAIYDPEQEFHLRRSGAILSS